MTGTAFEGLRVVEIGSYVSAPFAGKCLADFGAEVIKVEPPEGDPARKLGPFPGDEVDTEKSGMFLFLNTNKLGVTLDLGTATGRELLRRLLVDTDVLVENNSPSVMREWGLTYEALCEVNPRLVMTSVTPFGQSGPYAEYRTTPLVSYAMSGLAYETPSGGVGEDRIETYPPVSGWGWQVAFVAAFNAAWATVAALLQRDSTGRGQHVDVSELESGAATLRPNVIEPSYLPREPGWAKTKRSQRTGGGIYRTNDGYVSIGANDEHQWARWKAVMGNPEWAESEIFGTILGRREHMDALHLMAEGWTTQLSKREITEQMQEARTIAFPVYRPREVLDDEHNAVREVFVEHDHPVAGRVRFPGAPFKLSQSPWQLVRPAPQLGEHNAEVLGSRLGLSADELVQLRGVGTI
jgi:crotonobetainyl-CoA:carnitine CoA-transferase CaiB-like acyl-CoA transferase